MSKIHSDQKPSFFPSKSNHVPIQGKGQIQPALPPRNNIEKQHDLIAKTEQDVKVRIPDSIKDFARIKRVVDLAPDIDNSDKIAKLKDQINSGKYQIDYDALADKILQNEF